jgi:hypothetical protein
MFTNRFFTVLVILALAAVAGLTVQETIATSSVISNVEEADTARWEAMGEYYANQAQRYTMDSATRSHIAWGEALQAAGKLGDSAACSNTTQENIFAGIDSSLDSATRSYIAWGLALQAKDDIRALCR